MNTLQAALPPLLGFSLDSDTLHVSVPLPAGGWRAVMKVLLAKIGPEWLFDPSNQDDAYLRHAIIAMPGARLVSPRGMETYVRARRVAIEVNEDRTYRVWNPRTGQPVANGSLYTLYDELCEGGGE